MMIYLLLKIACLAICMAYLTPMKYPVKKTTLIIVICQSLMYFANMAIYIFLGDKVFSAISLFTIGIPGFFCFNFLSKYKGFRVLFSLMTVTLFATFSSFLGHMADVYFSDAMLQYFIKFLSFILITVYVAAVLRKPYLKLMLVLHRGWGWLTFIPFLLINAVCLLQYYPSPIENRPENIPVIILVFMITFAFYTFVYANFANILEYFELKRNKDVLSMQAQMYQNEYKAMMDNLDSNRIFRHDMRHHLGVINAFLSDGNLAEVRKYIRKLNGSLKENSIKKYCENYGVNAVLSSLIDRARSEGIEVQCEANIPQDIPLDSMDLGLIFANALDNAIYACRKLHNTSDKMIKVDCREHCGQIYIRVSNPYTGDVQFSGEFPVSSESEHGIGTKSIAAIAQKHNGVYSFDAQDGVFKMSVTLKY